MSKERQRVVSIVKEVIMYDLVMIRHAIEHKLRVYEFEDLKELPLEEKRYLFYLNDIYFLLKNSKDKTTFIRWFYMWENESYNRYEIVKC